VTERTHEGRVAVVSGAARGIGRAIAEGLAARGARVAAADLLDPVETMRAIADSGGDCAGVVADVGSEQDVQRLREEVHARLGRCDVLVNNAALLRQTPLHELDYELWREVLRCNLDSQFLMARAFLPDMIESGWGRVVNVASSSVLTSTRGLVAYMASKGGVLGLTSALANEVGRHGITVNAVSPGLTRTPGVDDDIRSGRLPEQALDAVVAQQAIPRAGTPSDVVGAVLLLTSDDASFMTGQFLVVDGGMTRR
jgi:NAD(P)-dependent dehydrogenase (short-subunit alcohol dehydrogenase family)